MVLWKVYCVLARQLTDRNGLGYRAIQQRQGSVTRGGPVTVPDLEPHPTNLETLESPLFSPCLPLGLPIQARQSRHKPKRSFAPFPTTRLSGVPKTGRKRYFAPSFLCPERLGLKWYRCRKCVSRRPLFHLPLPLPSSLLPSSSHLSVRYIPLPTLPLPYLTPRKSRIVIPSSPSRPRAIGSESLEACAFATCFEMSGPGHPANTIHCTLAPHCA